MSERVVRLRQWAVSSARSALARNAGKLTLAEGLALVLALVQAALVARWLGPRDFGIAALIIAFPALVFTIFDAQPAEALVKYLGEFRATNQPRKALAVTTVAYVIDGLLAVVGFFVVAAMAPWAADHVIHAEQYAGLLLVAAAGQTLTAPVDTSRGILTSFGRFTTIAWSQSVCNVVRFVLVVGAVATGGGVSGFIVAMCAGMVLDSVAMGWLANRAQRQVLGHSWWHGRRADIADRLREIIRFLIYTDLTSLVSVFIKQADLVILGAISGPVQAGYYRLARSLTSPVTSVTVSLQAVLYPQVSHLAASVDGHVIIARVRKWFSRAGVPLAFASLAVIPFVPQLIELVAGPDFVGASAAARWLLLGSAFVLACFWLRPIQLATGQVRFMFVNGTVLGVLCVIGFALFAGPFGAAGVAAVRTIVAGFAGSTAGILWLRHLYRKGTLVVRPDLVAA
jgi:O-antigen/teichoic acid export membrane protein